MISPSALPCCGYRANILIETGLGKKTLSGCEFLLIHTAVHKVGPVILGAISGIYENWPIKAQFIVKDKISWNKLLFD